METLPGWEVAIAEHLGRPGDSIGYTYDFGDGWRHQILLEGILLADPSVTYPACIGGERACPPDLVRFSDPRQRWKDSFQSMD
jgi:hypothetical protein